jgi:hypothetical protein
MDTEERDLQYVIDHVFLPPKIEQEDDYTPARNAHLLSVFLQGLRLWHSGLPGEVRSKWDPCVNMVHAMYELQGTSPELEFETLLTDWNALEAGGAYTKHPWVSH